MFMVIGLLVTLVIWGFIGGCGTKRVSWKTEGGAAGHDLPESPYNEAGSSGLYIVEPGDSLWRISRKYDVSIGEIKKTNNLSGDTISVGQSLFIPDLFPAQEKEPSSVSATSVKIRQRPGLVVYTVRKGDSLWRIAQTHGTTITKITDLNGISNKVRLMPGQEILVPAKK